MLGNKIKILRKEKGYSQEKLAEMLNVNSVTVSKWENNEMTPRISNIQKIADIFNVNTSYLIDKNENLEQQSKVLEMVKKIQDEHISPDIPFTMGTDGKTMTYKIGNTIAKLPFDKDLAILILKTIINNEDISANTNNMSINGNGNIGKQFIGNDNKMDGEN